MSNCYTSKKSDVAIPVTFVTTKSYTTWLEQQSTTVKQWLAATQFRPEANAMRLLPDASGKIASVLSCANGELTLWSAGSLPFSLPEGEYYFDVAEAEYKQLAIAWGLGSYQFTRYKKPQRIPAKLYLPAPIAAEVENMVDAICMTRDWINTPTDDMGPTEMADVAAKLAHSYGATFTQIIGDDLLKQNYASIYTVGRASDDAPRLLDMRWGNEAHPKITLVGKGVCFDTGGLDIKSSSYMLLMKKDMGGAAHVFGLARMIMQANLPIRLRVLVPAVENAVSGNAYRPGDVITSRSGKTIEVGNTDAEGRVILADALTEAVAEKPALLIDMTTLTGAARVALGTELPALFSNNDKLAHEVLACGEAVMDPMWRLPLFAAYREHLNSQIADINNNSSESYGGAISAALFLKEFVPDEIPWLHFDLMAWNTKTRPGRPQGGEAMTLRALFNYIKKLSGV